MAELFDHHRILRVEMVVRVNYLVRKVSLLLVLLELSDLNQEIPNIFDQIPQTHKRQIVRICF